MEIAATNKLKLEVRARMVDEWANEAAQTENDTPVRARLYGYLYVYAC